MSDQLTMIATAAFGLEAVVARELKQLGISETKTEDGRVRFSGTHGDLCRANLWLRCAERILVVVGEFDATDFGQLFDQTNQLPWEAWIPQDGEFPVRGKSVRSQLHSVPDCQKIVKKAIVERLKQSYAINWFEENGSLYPIDVHLLNDRCTITLDTSGPGLHKRGYRALTGQAPLKETLAAALVQLSYWNENRLLIDPCCGTGTILIEAALIGRNMAPGLNRTFAAEQWRQVAKNSWTTAREEARDNIKPSLGERLSGFDIDFRPLKLAREAARQAGVEPDIHFQERPLSEFGTSRKYGVIITNPPYGERVGTQEQAEQLYLQMAEKFRPLDTWSTYLLTSHPRFEKLYGRRAGRRRKLFNARIACTYYQYPGPRPPRRESGTIGTRLECRLTIRYAAAD